MIHPLLTRLHDELGYPSLDLDGHSRFLGSPGVVVLFFPGDPAKFKDTTDVAVVLPEIVGAFPGRLRPAVVVDVAADAALMERYAFSHHPALVFVQNGALLGSICGIRDWMDYVAEVKGMLNRAEGRQPRIPMVQL